MYMYIDAATKTAATWGICVTVAVAELGLPHARNPENALSNL